MPPKKASSRLTDAAASHHANLRADDHFHLSMAETSSPIQSILVTMDQFNLLFQHVNTLMATIQAVQIAIAPPPMVLQPS